MPSLGVRTVKSSGASNIDLWRRQTAHRSCKCEAVCSRTVSMTKSSEVANLECSLCGSTLVSWNTAFHRWARSTPEGRLPET